MCIDLHITQLSQSGLCLCLWHASVNSVWQSMSLVVPLCWYLISIPLWFWCNLMMRDVFPVLWKRTLLALQKIWRSSDLEKIVTLPGRSCHRNDIAQRKKKEEETHYLLSNFLLPICLIVMPCTKYVLSIYPSCKSQRCEYHRRLHRCHFKRHILPQCPTLSWTSLSKTSCSFSTDVPSVSLWPCK